MTDRFVLERRYAVPPERIFKAWTDRALLTQWFGCGPNMLWDVHEWDVRPGGAIRVSLDFDGQPYDVRGVFEVVEPPRHLRYRWSKDETVDVTIAALPQGSLLRIEHRWPPTDDDRSMIEGGWTSAAAQLEESLSAERVS